jgi:hypothetical protein
MLRPCLVEYFQTSWRTSTDPSIASFLFSSLPFVTDLAKTAPPAVIIPSTFVSAGLIFGMFGTSSPVGAIAFSILYGFFSGGCKLAPSSRLGYPHPPRPKSSHSSRRLQHSSLKTSASSGAFRHFFFAAPGQQVPHRTRVGLLSFVIGFALLTGNPIAGALLSPPSYTWWRPFLFATVCPHAFPPFLPPSHSPYSVWRPCCYHPGRHLRWHPLPRRLAGHAGEAERHAVRLRWAAACAWCI